MTGLTDRLSTSFKPVLAVMVYASGEEFNQQFYLESHHVDQKGQILEGKPLQDETLSSVVDVFFDQRKLRSDMQGVIPETVLKYVPLNGSYELVWFNPPQIRMLHFADQLKIKSGQAWVPGLIYRATNESLDVYAYSGKGRPGPGTKLFRAPFFNVNDRGDVCLGSAKVKKPAEKTFASITKYWEDLFWLSEFTHVNGDKVTKSKLDQVWRKLIKQKPTVKWTDIKELLPQQGVTMKQILK